MTEYGSITRQTVKELTVIVGRNNISTDKSEMEGYSYDEKPLATRYFPDVVVKPGDAVQVSKLLAFANEKRIPVTPRGAGTGLSGGSIPIYGGILLSLERMNRILEIDKENFVAVLEPGVTLSYLCSEVEQQGLYYPLYPGEMTATIGGNVATNAGGMNAVKYGVTRHNILGLEAVLPGGATIKTGGEFVKSSTGYDLTQLIIGSEGTLAVFVSARIRLLDLPKNNLMARIYFKTLVDAGQSVLPIRELAPSGLEIVDGATLDLIGRVQFKIPGNAAAMLLAEFDERNKASLNLCVLVLTRRQRDSSDRVNEERFV